MSGRPDQSLERLRTYAVEVDEAVALRHLAAMRSALAEAPATAAVSPVTASSRGRLRHRIAASLAGLILAGAPVGAAVAAESTVPGDLLYPVKEVTERVRSIVDHDIIAEHRVDELETLLDRGADPETLARQTERARLALAGVGDDSALQIRFRRALGRVDEAGGPGGADNGPDDGTGPDGEGGNGGARHGQDPATDPAGDSGTRATTTTVANRSDDGGPGGESGPGGDGDPSGPTGTTGNGDTDRDRLGDANGDAPDGGDATQDQDRDRDGAPQSGDPAPTGSDPSTTDGGGGERNGEGAGQTPAETGTGTAAEPAVTQSPHPHA